MNDPNPEKTEEQMKKSRYEFRNPSHLVGTVAKKRKFKRINSNNNEKVVFETTGKSLRSRVIAEKVPEKTAINRKTTTKSKVYTKKSKSSCRMKIDTTSSIAVVSIERSQEMPKYRKIELPLEEMQVSESVEVETPQNLPLYKCISPKPEYCRMSIILIDPLRKLFLDRFRNLMVIQLGSCKPMVIMDKLQILNLNGQQVQQSRNPLSPPSVAALSSPIRRPVVSNSQPISFASSPIFQRSVLKVKIQWDAVGVKVLTFPTTSSNARLATVLKPNIIQSPKFGKIFHFGAQLPLYTEAVDEMVVSPPQNNSESPQLYGNKKIEILSDELIANQSPPKNDFITEESIFITPTPECSTSSGNSSGAASSTITCPSFLNASHSTSYAIDDDESDYDSEVTRSLGSLSLSNCSLSSELDDDEVKDSSSPQKPPQLPPFQALKSNVLPERDEYFYDTFDDFAYDVTNNLNMEIDPNETVDPDDENDSESDLEFEKMQMGYTYNTDLVPDCDLAALDAIPFENLFNPIEFIDLDRYSF